MQDQPAARPQPFPGLGICSGTGRVVSPCAVSPQVSLCPGPPTPPQPRGYHGKRDTGWPAAGPGSLARPRWEKERRKRRIWGIHAVTVTQLALSGCQRGTHGAQSSSALVAAVPPPRCLARHPPAGRGRAAPRRLARCSSWGCSATGNQTWVTRWQIAPRWCHPAQGYPLPGDPLPAPCL